MELLPLFYNSSHEIYEPENLTPSGMWFFFCFLQHSFKKFACKSGKPYAPNSLNGWTRDAAEKKKRNSSANGSAERRSSNVTTKASSTAIFLKCMRSPTSPMQRGSLRCQRSVSLLSQTLQSRRNSLQPSRNPCDKKRKNSTGQRLYQV